MYILPKVNYGRDLEDYVSKDFQYWEFISSDKAVRLGIKNVPTEAEWKNIEYLVEHGLQPIRDALGKPLEINSGFRCKKLNDSVGSSDTSFHRLGCAVDIDSDKVKLLDILEIAYELPEWSEIIAEFYPNGWNHFGLRQGDNRQMLKLKDATHNYSRITIEELKEMYA